MRGGKTGQNLRLQEAAGLGRHRARSFEYGIQNERAGESVPRRGAGSGDWDVGRQDEVVHGFHPVGFDSRRH